MTEPVFFRLFLQDEKKALTEVSAFFMLVPVGGLEPPHPKATDFESVVSTNSTTLALKR